MSPKAGLKRCLLFIQCHATKSLSILPTQKLWSIEMQSEESSYFYYCRLSNVSIPLKTCLTKKRGEFSFYWITFSIFSFLGPPSVKKRNLWSLRTLWIREPTIKWGHQNQEVTEVQHKKFCTQIVDIQRVKITTKIHSRTFWQKFREITIFDFSIMIVITKSDGRMSNVIECFISSQKKVST